MRIDVGKGCDEFFLLEGLESDRVDVILEEFESIDAGFDIAEDGDLLVIQPFKIQEVIDHIESKKKS